MWTRRLWGIFAPLLVLVLCCGFQTVWWPSLMGNLPSPAAWLLVLVWLSLYRPDPFTIILIYAGGFLASAFTTMPLRMMFPSLLILHVLIAITRERVFWTGVSYFILAAVCSTAVYQVILMVLSAFLERHYINWLPFERIMQILLAAPMAYLIYFLMGAVIRPLPAESRTTEEGGA